MTIAKRFRWEGAHRLPWHAGGCQHLHGHSYHLWVELDGEPDAQGMLLDFKEIKRALQPLIETWDHATLVAEADGPLQAALEQLGTKYVVFPYDTTAENLCRFAADYLLDHAGPVLRAHGITTVRIRVQETETCFAAVTKRVPAVTNGHAGASRQTERKEETYG